MSNQNTVIILDALNHFFRSYIIDPSLTPNGDPVGGVRTFLRILQSEIKKHSPDEVLIAWDGAGGSKRKKNMDKDYKEGRSAVNLNRAIEDMLNEDEKRRNMAWQQVRIIDYLNNLPVKQFMYDNVEADDVIAYLTRIDEYEGWRKVIVSNDKDFIQLVSEDGVVLHRPTSDEMLDSEEIIDQYGVAPENFTLARAMSGDKSDNLDGVRGIGIKTAGKRFPFLQEEEQHYLDDLFDHARNSESGYKAHEKVLNERKKVRKNYKMMQLYSPLLSPDNKEDIEETASNAPPKFQRLEIRKKMQKDDIVDDNWSELFSFCRQKQLEIE